MHVKKDEMHLLWGKFNSIFVFKPINRNLVENGKERAGKTMLISLF